MKTDEWVWLQSRRCYVRIVETATTLSPEVREKHAALAREADAREAAEKAEEQRRADRLVEQRGKVRAAARIEPVAVTRPSLWACVEQIPALGESISVLVHGTLTERHERLADAKCKLDWWSSRAASQHEKVVFFTHQVQQLEVLLSALKKRTAKGQQVCKCGFPRSHHWRGTNACIVDGANCHEFEKGRA